MYVNNYLCDCEVSGKTGVKVQHQKTFVNLEIFVLSVISMKKKIVWHNPLKMYR